MLVSKLDEIEQGPAAQHAAGSASALPTPPGLSEGRDEAVRKQLEYHWKLVEICLQGNEKGVCNIELRRLTNFHSAILAAKKERVITEKESVNYKKRNLIGNLAKHTPGPWEEARKKRGFSAPPSSTVPAVPVAGLQAVTAQVRHHMQLVRECQAARLNGQEWWWSKEKPNADPERKAQNRNHTFDNFRWTIDYASGKEEFFQFDNKTGKNRLDNKGNPIPKKRHHVAGDPPPTSRIIPEKLEEKLREIHEAGNKWKHEKSIEYLQGALAMARIAEQYSL